MLGASPVIDAVPLKKFCRQYLQDREHTEIGNGTGSFLLDVVAGWIECQRWEFWDEEVIGSSTWLCSLPPQSSSGHNASMEYICHAFVSWFAGAKCGNHNPFVVTEELLKKKGLQQWRVVSCNSSNLQKIMVGSQAPKGKQDNMCLRANDKQNIYLLTHVILPAAGYSKSHTNRLEGFSPNFLQDIYHVLAAVFSLMNSNNVIDKCNHGVLLYTSRDATWAKEEEVFLEVMIALMFLYRFDPSVYHLTPAFRMTVNALRHTYECPSKTIAIATETTIKYHWAPEDQDLHTVVLRYMFLEAADVIPV